MREIELLPPEDPITWVEAMATRAGLTKGLRRTLKTYPGSVHWHLTKPGERGVLEVTWWPASRRLWLKVHPMREADWIDEAIAAFISGGR